MQQIDYLRQVRGGCYKAKFGFGKFDQVDFHTPQSRPQPLERKLEFVNDTQDFHRVLVDILLGFVRYGKELFLRLFRCYKSALFARVKSAIHF